MEENKDELLKKIKEQTEKKLKEISEVGITAENLDNLYKLIDIHKDLENENYWKVKEENYMYRDDYRNYGNYDNYGGGRRRDSQGRYMGDNSYGRHNYRGQKYLDNMYDDYNRYSEGKEMANRGNYGAKDDSMKSLEYMMDSVVCFVEMLKEEATPEEMEIIRKHARKISEM